MKSKRYISIFLFFFLFQLVGPLFANYEGDSLPINPKRPKVGLVLSGGGAKGFAYIGLFRVLEEVGLSVDYVGGASIGSIMAGFYSLGYSADEIEKIIRAQDWDMVLRDEIHRKYIAYDEKEIWDKSIVSLPFQKKKIGMGGSLYYGQQVNLLLNRFFSSAWNQPDFRLLPTPFLCVGTDLFNGKSVELTTGYLPMAVRSSMSIPGYFSPTLYQGKYLVDGGVVNNYPAVDVKNMGAQFIIGGDVQSALKDSIDQLSSVTAVIDQIVSYSRIHANMEARELINIDIQFPVNAGMMDFTAYDSIIAGGERVARAHYSELKNLADSLNAIEYRPLKKRDAKILESISIAEVKYEGNKKMSTIYLDNYFEEFENETVSIDDIEETVTMVYGTGFFKYVFYELMPSGDGRANLIIKMEESAPGYVSAAIHYDVDYQGSIMLGGVFRNVLGNRSKLFTELILGSNPRFKAFYTISNGAKPSFGAEVDMYNFKFYDYEKEIKVNQIDFSSFNFALFLTRTKDNMLNWRMGLQYEYFRFKQDVSIYPSIDSISNFTSYGNAFVSIKGDSRDKSYFSSRGFLLNAKVLYVIPLANNWSQEMFNNSLVFYAKYEQNISLNSKIVLKPGLFAGGTLRQDAPPVQHWFGAGGLNQINYITTFVPFSGIHFVQKIGNYAGIGRLKLQYNVFQKIYLTLRTDVGNVELDYEDVFDAKNLMLGYGGTVSYNSFIGPIEFSLLGSNLNSGMMVFFNLGFDF